MKPITKIKIIVEGVSIQGNAVAKGAIIDVMQPGEVLSGTDIHLGVAKNLIFNGRAEALKDSAVKKADA